MTAAMMNDAVTGTASPSRITAIAAKNVVNSSIMVGLFDSTSARSTMIPDRSSPRPVIVSTATISPAEAQVAATGRTPDAPLASAANTFGGVIRCFLSRKDNRKASNDAYTTALNAD